MQPFQNDREQELPEISHRISFQDNIHSLKPLWSREVYTYPAIKDIQMVAIDDKVYLLGSTQQAESGLIVMQGRSGRILWQKRGNFLDVAADTTAVYLSEASSVLAISPETGESIWTVKLPGFHNNVIYLYVVDDILYTKGSVSGERLLDVHTGDIYDMTKTFTQLPPSILNRVPTIKKNKIFFGAGQKSVGFCIAYQRHPYKFLWRTKNENVISNIAASNKVVYFLTADDEIMMLDANTGESLATAYITPSINFFKNQGAVQHEGYHIAVDDENNRLYVILGDSNQMFAFQILLEEEMR